MKGNGNICVARVLHPMEADVVCKNINLAWSDVIHAPRFITVDVANIIRVHRRSRNLLQLFLALAALAVLIASYVCARWLQVGDNRVGLVGPVVLNLRQAPLEHLHEAVAVGVIVNGRRLSLVPAQDHQVETVVSGIDEISRVPGRVQDREIRDKKSVSRAVCQRSNWPCLRNWSRVDCKTSKDSLIKETANYSRGGSSSQVNNKQPSTHAVLRSLRFYDNNDVRGKFFLASLNICLRLLRRQLASRLIHAHDNPRELLLFFISASRRGERK